MKLSDLSNLSTKRLKALAEHNINSLADLLNFFPRRYLDHSSVTPIRNVEGSGEKVSVVGRIKKVRQQGYGKKKRLEVIIQDDTASLKGVWFRGAYYMKKQFSAGDVVVFFGQAKKYGRYVSIAHPDFEKIESSSDLKSIKRIVPIYPGSKAMSNARINSKLIQKWQKVALSHTSRPEFLTKSLLKDHDLPGRKQAYRMIHFPESQQDYQLARKRFKFEDFLLFELSVAKTKYTMIERDNGPLLKNMDDLTSRFFNKHIPFELTDAQKNALGDIKQDVRSGRQMNRLLQGDVGSGKTIVAIGTMLMALDNGYQAAFMAPTEILAEQHYRTLKTLLQPLDINIRLLTGNQKADLRTDILTAIEGGQCQIAVGTHAIIQDKVSFHRLGLAVIDEQHRFGVQQRAEVLKKGTHPHVLVMSATPIPRSLAMTMYSDLDISVMDELPGGRKPVKTAIRSIKKMETIYQFVQESLQKGGQTYVVYPLVEESEKVDLKDATAGFEQLSKRFSDYEVALLHGRMSAEDKDETMKRFAQNDVQLLVSTTVIEVGVDVANANIMIIRHAERFGLSQLHQLRGRIGRGKRQSYCILVPDQQISKEAKFRLHKMVETNDGFEIAEADLKLRGPGDFLGTKQSGLPEFRIGDIVEDRPLLKQAKTAAWQILNSDPDLSESRHQSLKKVFSPYYKKRKQFFGIG